MYFESKNPSTLGSVFLPHNALVLDIVKVNSNRKTQNNVEENSWIESIPQSNLKFLKQIMEQTTFMLKNTKVTKK